MTPALDAVRREELRKLAEAATPGPWRASETEPSGEQCVHAAGSPQQMFTAWRSAGRLKGEFPYQANAAYIAAMSPDTTLALLAYIAELEAAVEEALNDGKDAGADFVFEVLSGAIGATGWYTQDGSETWEGDVSATLYHILYKGGVLDPETNQRALLPKASVREERGHE